MTQAYDVDALLNTMSDQAMQVLNSRGITDPVMVGIHTGGAWVAEQLHQRMHLKEPLGTLNISFYRDDFTRIGMHPQVKPSNLPFSIEGRCVLLVDDVLFTGRTIRAALNEIFDYGRPSSVMLAVLVDRGGRELPIQADIVGTRIDLDKNTQIKLTGPQPLQLIQRAKQMPA